MEEMKRRQIPAFGQWESYCDDVPITQYFESARQDGRAEEDDDLFKAPAPRSRRPPHNQTKSRDAGGGGGEKRQRRKQGVTCKVGDQQIQQASRPPKAVDEDLYKIPAELLCQKPKRRRFLRNLLSGCMSLNCIR